MLSRHQETKAFRDRGPVKGGTFEKGDPGFKRVATIIVDFSMY